MDRYVADEKTLVMTRRQVREFDRWAIEELGIPGVVLMENAGRSCAELILERLSRRRDLAALVVCGAGNNGGDGFVIARHLLNAGLTVNVLVCGRREKVQGDARINLDILERIHRPVEMLDPADATIADTVRRLAEGADVIVDALFGTGLNGPLGAEYQQIIGRMNTAGKPILAVDIPSGLDCDTGEPLGACVAATWTVTFVAVKKGFLVGPAARRYTGEIYVASIGVSSALYPAGG